jgi:hypothetical protein
MGASLSSKLPAMIRVSWPRWPAAGHGDRAVREMRWRCRQCGSGRFALMVCGHRRSQELNGGLAGSTPRAPLVAHSQAIAMMSEAWEPASQRLRAAVLEVSPPLGSEVA